MLLKNIFVLLGVSLLGALLGTSTSPISTKGPVEIGATSGHAPTYTSRTFAAEKPTPAKPAAEPVAPRQVAVRARGIDTDDFPHFKDRPSRRKVKYGKNRWVILG